MCLRPTGRKLNACRLHARRPCSSWPRGAPCGRCIEEFRKEVLALDPCVSEEILKLYVAYKCRDATSWTWCLNRADLRLVAQHALPVSSTIHKELSKRCDQILVRRWGNGDVEVGLSKNGPDMPYIMGLVRQAFDEANG